MEKYRYYFLSAIIISLTAVFLPADFVSPVFIAALGLLIGLSATIFYGQGDSKETAFLINIFIAAFLSRIIAASFLYHFVFLTNNSGLIGDSEMYHQSANSILDMWLSGIKDNSYIYYQVRSTNRAGTLGEYDFYTAGLYFFFGRNPLVPTFINSLAGALTLLIVYDITRTIYNKKAALFAAILTGFWPSTFLWSIQSLKEPIVTFAGSLLVWSFLKIKIGFRFYYMLLAAMATLVLMPFRGFLVLVFYLFILPLAFLTSSKLKMAIGALLLFLGCAAIFLYMDNLKTLIPPSIANSNEMPLEWLYRTRSYRAYGGSAFLRGWDFTSLPKFIIFAPLAFMIAWLAPFPWQMGSARQIISMPEMLLFYLLIPCMLYGARFIVKNKFKEGSLIIFYIMIISSILALVEGNVGTLFRHKSMILPLCFVLIAIGMEKYNFRISAHK